MNEKMEHFILLLGGKEPRLIRDNKFLPEIFIPSPPELKYPSTTDGNFSNFTSIEYETYKFVGMLDDILLYRLEQKF